MKIGNVTALPSVCLHPHITGINTCLKASIGNKTDYYPTFSLFLYLQNHLHVLTHFDANYYIILSVILTQPFIVPCIICTRFHIHFFPLLHLICISVPFISFFVTHSCKTAIFTYWLLYL